MILLDRRGGSVHPISALEATTQKNRRECVSNVTTYPSNEMFSSWLLHVFFGPHRGAQPLESTVYDVHRNCARQHITIRRRLVDCIPNRQREIGRDRERQRDRDRERHTERDTQRDRERDTQRYLLGCATTYLPGMEGFPSEYPPALSLSFLEVQSACVIRTYTQD